MTWDGAVPGVPDATIRTVATLPELLPGARQVGPHSQARPGALLRIVPGVARFLVKGGNQIDIAVEKHADAADVTSFLLGGVRGALIHQRGELPMHAATVLTPDGRGAMAICGESGAGKSTLAAELVSQGWALLSDDVTRITCADSTVSAWPCTAGIKLKRDALERLGLPTDRLQRAAAGKLILPVAARTLPAPLKWVIVLNWNPSPARRVITGGAALAMLTEQTFRLHYVTALGMAVEHLRMISRVATACTCVTISRHCGVTALADTLTAMQNGDSAEGIRPSRLTSSPACAR
jgi:hypothetical protein